MGIFDAFLALLEDIIFRLQFFFDEFADFLRDVGLR